MEDALDEAGGYEACIHVRHSSKASGAIDIPQAAKGEAGGQAPRVARAEDKEELHLGGRR